MEYFIIFIFQYKKYKNMFSFISFFLIFLNLIPQIVSITSEIKISSLQNLSFLFNSSFNNNRKLNTQLVYGNAIQLYYYYTNLYLGEKMQEQGFIINTDHEVTTSTCSLCQKCGKHNLPYYNVNSNEEIISCSDEKCKMVNSLNCYNISNNCSFQVSYIEGSKINGVYINELIRFGGNYKSQNGTFIPLGCSIIETNLIYSQKENGILGLANNNQNFVELLYQFGAIKNNIFSLCLSKSGGLFEIGEINNQTHKENITYVPMRTYKRKNYLIEVNSIYVNNAKNNISQVFQFSLNSGTSFIYLNIKLFNEIISKIEKECQKLNKTNICGNYVYNSDFGLCFNFDNEEQLNNAIKTYWPTIHFIIGEYDYDWDTKKKCY